jgi:hypothetical protein
MQNYYFVLLACMLFGGSLFGMQAQSYVSSDAKWMVTKNSDGDLILWNTQTGASLILTSSLNEVARQTIPSNPR